MDELKLDAVLFPAVADVGTADAHVNPASADIGMPVGLTFAGRAYDDNKRIIPPRTPEIGQ
ncbi:hypothetical protein GCM10011607_14710 [Shewanella inventionis]|uniref:Amidase domain-containing protein n=1 Tax=Shewanella inventionis TaxID=1738770 RepID=A0ABQ1IZN7_9GAMM|nr:hypothetical protein GCM10011607_14710 [Shewanella inventionis]